MGRHKRSESAAWPSFKFELNNGPDERPVVEARKIMIAVDATKNLELDALMWAFNHVVKAGDLVVLLSVVHRIRCPMGYMTYADPSCFNGTNARVLGDELTKRMKDCQRKLRNFSQLCSEKKVRMNIRVRAGYPLKLMVVMEACVLKAACVVLDRRLKIDQTFYSHFLFCDAVMVLGKDDVIIVRSDVELDTNVPEGDDVGGHEELQDIALKKKLNGTVLWKMNSLKNLMSMQIKTSGVKEPAASPAPLQLPGPQMRPDTELNRSMSTSIIELKHFTRAALPRVWETAQSFYASREKIVEEDFSTSSSSSVLLGGPGRWKPPPRRSLASFEFKGEKEGPIIRPELSIHDQQSPLQRSTSQPIELSSHTTTSGETSPVTAAMLYAPSVGILDHHRHYRRPPHQYLSHQCILHKRKPPSSCHPPSLYDGLSYCPSGCGRHVPALHQPSYSELCERNFPFD